MRENQFQVVQEFCFEESQKMIRTMLDRNGEPWFVAKDVCDILEHTNITMALKSLDEDEKDLSKVYPFDSGQAVNIINLPGLFTLLTRSPKPQAAPFRRWVMHDVIPSIYRIGFYGMNVPANIPESIDEATSRWSYVHKQKQAIKDRLKMLGEAEKVCRAFMIANSQPYHVPINQQLSLPKMP